MFWRGTVTGSRHGRSPGKLAWARFRRDRTGMIAAAVVLAFFAAGLAAPLIASVYGKNPYETYGQDTPGLLDDYGFPVKANGGMDTEYWLGLEPGLGRDVLTQLLYGIRTSLLIAIGVVAIVTALGVLAGLIAGFFGGATDFVIGRVIDILLAFPGLLFLIAIMPVVTAAFVSPDEETPVWLRIAVLIIVLSVFGWTRTARLVRAQVLSLREREFVNAARISGGGPWWIIRRELLPNLWTPILVVVTLDLPAYVTAEAALSFLGVGVIEPTPDWGRMIHRGAQVYVSDITYMIFPGLAMLIFVVAFNLLGDAVRDALDAKASR